MQHMYSNLKRWLNSPSVLHMSLVLVRAEHGRAARCMLEWLGYSGEGILRKLVAGTKLTDREVKTKVTESNFNNRGVISFLATHPVWSDQLRAVGATLTAIFRRQARSFGCPEPPHAPSAA